MSKKINKLILTLAVVLIAFFSVSCNILPLGSSTDGQALINGVYGQDVITANVSVNLCVFDRTFTGNRVNEVNSQGSGVIFKKQEYLGKPLYYILTNNHVIYRADVSRHFEYTVKDCYGNTFSASVEYSSADYDLAVLSFTSEEEYKILSFASANPLVKAVAVSMGNPLGVLNAVTYGEVLAYTTVSLSSENGFTKEMSNVTFQVVKHSAYMDSGSSGGVLLDDNYRICAINYAAEVDDDGNFISGYAVPVEQVIEFINANA